MGAKVVASALIVGREAPASGANPAGANLSLRVCGMSDLRPATSVESLFRRRKTSAIALAGGVPVVVHVRKRVT